MLNPATTSPSPKTDSPFDKKWKQIEKSQKRNAAAKVKVDNLYQTFQETVLGEEQKYVELLAQETQHLISFLPRKSFTHWQREELKTWIEDNIDTLSTYPFGNHDLFEAVVKNYNVFLMEQAKAVNENRIFSHEEISHMRAMLNDVLRGGKQFTDDELVAFLREPELLKQMLNEYQEENTHQENNDDDFDNDFQGDYANEHQSYHDEQQEKKQKHLKSLFDTSKLNKLYKMLANRLHPDKEPNEDLKHEKSALMATLITAKNNKDAFTIISMFHQFIPNSDELLFTGNDEELTTALMALLDEKLRELDSEHRDMKYNDGIKSMVWNNFHGRSKKATQEKFDIHLANLEDDHDRLNFYIHEVKTVTSLKQILSERYEQRQELCFSDGHFSLDDLGELFRQR